MKKLTLISGLLLLMLLKSAAQQPPGVSLVVVQFSQPPTFATVTKTPLRYNKTFAFSFHHDDGAKDIYSHAFKFLNGGVVNGITYPGLKFTDGAGNDIYFRMSAAIYSFEQGGAIDGRDPNGPYAAINVTWPELIEMYQAGWGIYNHNLTSANAGNYIYEIRRNHSYVKRKTQAATQGGVDMQVFVNPAGDINYTQPAFNEGYIVAYREGYTFGVPHFNVNTVWNPQQLRMGRTNIYHGISLTGLVNSIAAESVGGQNRWGSAFTHSVTNPSWGLSFQSFKDQMNSIAALYGKNGADNIWMTTEEEILNYRIVHDLTIVYSVLAGNLLAITLTGNIPDNLRFYALSLLVNADAPISNITILGGEGHTHTSPGTTQALINLQWDGKVIVPPEVNAETYVSIAEASGTQDDVNVAMDYVEMVPPGAVKESFRERLCAIPNVTLPTAYCFCPIQATPDTTICYSHCVTLTVSSGAFYLWSTGDTTQTITVCPDQTTLYYVTVINNVGCSASDSVLVTVMPAPVANAGADTTICFGGCATLTATGGTSYIWNTGQTSASVTVCPQITTSFWVTAFNQYGCYSSDTVVVSVIPNQPAVTTPDTTICIGSCVELTVYGGIQWVWSTGQTSQTILVCPDTTTYYYVEVTYANGCITFDTITVTVNPLPVIQVSSDTAVCFGQAVHLSATGGIAYLWSNGAVSPDIVVYPVTDTLFWVQVLGSEGCIASDTVQITVFPIPHANLGSDLITCEGYCVDLVGPDGMKYLWSTGDTTQVITVCPETTTSYWLKVLNEHHCETTDTILITVLPPVVPVITADTTICLGDCIMLTASGGDYYLWSTGDTGNSIIVCPNVDSVFTVTISNAGCSADTSVFVSVVDLPGPEINNLLPAYCADHVEIELTVTPAGGIFEGPGITGNFFNPALAGPGMHTITYSIGDIGGCLKTDTLQTLVREVPLVQLGADTMLCDYEFIVLDAGAGFDTYLWSTGQTTRTIIADTAGFGTGTRIYTVIVTKGGCSGIASCTITFYECTGIFEAGNQQVKIYPNPARDYLNVRVDGCFNVIHYRLLDIRGITLHQEIVDCDSYNLNHFTIPVGGFAPGVYILSLYFNNSVINTRVIIN